MLPDTASTAAQESDGRPRPTLDNIRSWPATCDVPDAATAVGISRTTAYELAKSGNFPAKVIKVGGRYRVLTASLLAVLTGHEGGEAA